jgi:hypothetical protein
MKTSRILCAVLVMLLAVLYSQFTNATPLYYTFTGQVTENTYTGAEPWPGFADLAVGSEVSFTVLVDLFIPPDTAFPVDPVWGTTYYYAQYVDGSSPLVNQIGLSDSFGYAANSPSGWMVGVYGCLFANPANGADFGDAPFKIFSFDKIFSDWIVGDAVLGSEQTAFGQIGYSLTLGSTSDQLPVPEPSALSLMLGGLIIVGLCCGWSPKTGKVEI